MKSILTDLKKELRKKLISKRDALEAVSCFDEVICKCVLQTERYRTAEKIFVYISVNSEAPTRKLIEMMLSDGKKIYVPKCYGKGVMDAVRLESMESMVMGKYDIPTSDSSEIADPWELDIVFVPGVAFGENGERMGYGGGYYDRFLNKAENALKIGLCRSEMIEKNLICEAHDEKTDIIITEKGFYSWN